MSLKVLKFGGSSLADATHFRAVSDIVKAEPDRRYVVASAPGKRMSGDTKVTDLLYKCYELASNEEVERCGCSSSDVSTPTTCSPYMVQLSCSASTRRRFSPT